MSGVVTPAEARLIRAVRAVLREASVPELRTLITPTLQVRSPGPRRRRTKRKLSAPYERIGPTAMQLLTDSIRTGTVRALVRHGGWRKRGFIGPGEATLPEQRLWDAAPELALSFSAESYQLCRWLCGVPMSMHPRTLGDDLLFRLVADAVARCDLDLDPLADSPLVWLAHADRLALPSAELDWTQLLTSDGITVLLGLSDDHARRWARMEIRKAEVGAPGEHIERSQRQRAVIESFLDAIDRAGRRDLAGFLVDAGTQLVQRPAVAWVAGMPSTAPLSARSEAAREAAAVLRLYDRLARWYEAFAAMPFFEPEYHQAQLVVAQWEHLGRGGFSTLSRIADDLESGRPLTAAEEYQQS